MNVLSKTVVLILFACSIGASAQKNTGKYALLISSADHVNVAVKSAEQLFADKKYEAAQFEVIICGKAVEIFTRFEEWRAVLEEGRKLGVKFVVCGLSLKKAGIRQDSVPNGITVVPNGILTVYDLQKEKYWTIEL